MALLSLLLLTCVVVCPISIPLCFRLSPLTRLSIHLFLTTLHPLLIVIRLPSVRVISVEECFAALQGIARSKAPGSDGLPMEFYLKFWDVLGADLVAVLNLCFDSGSVTLLA